MFDFLFGNKKDDKSIVANNTENEIKIESKTENVTEKKTSEIETIPGISESKHKNVVLLALSSISGAKNGEASIRKTTYEYKNSTFYGWYQLEVIPKIIAYELKKKNECISEVIILSSSVTHQDELKKVEFDDSDCEDMINVTAEKLFINRMTDVIRPAEIAQDDFFTPIVVDENRSAKGLKDLADTIRAKYQDVKDNTDFYLVTNGGLRGIQRMQEAVVMLLKNENYHIEAAYGVEFDQKGKNSKIIDETKRLEIFEFVAGMNEFLDTGKNNSLERYLGKDDPVTKAMGQVADGIQWGDVTGFELGLKNIRSALAEKNNDHTGANDADSEEKTYLNIFKENIKLDYGKLIQDHDTVDEIEWCMKKNFYQQALALMESRMFMDFLNWGILKLVNADKTIKENEFFNGMINTCTDERTDELQQYFKDFEDLSKQFNVKCNVDKLRKNITDPFVRIEAISADFKCTCGHNKSKRVIKPFEFDKAIKNNSAIATDLYIILALHKSLKKVRNDMAHMNEKFKDKNIININLNLYIELAKKIREEINAFDGSSREFIENELTVDIKSIDENKKQGNNNKQNNNKQNNYKSDAEKKNGEKNKEAGTSKRYPTEITANAELCDAVERTELSKFAANAVKCNADEIRKYAKLIKYYMKLNGIEKSQLMDLQNKMKNFYDKNGIKVPSKENLGLGKSGKTGRALAASYPGNFVIEGEGNDQKLLLLS